MKNEEKKHNIVDNDSDRETYRLPATPANLINQMKWL